MSDHNGAVLCTKFLNFDLKNSTSKTCQKFFISKFKNLVNRSAPVGSNVDVPKFEFDPIRIEGLVRFGVISI